MSQIDLLDIQTGRFGGVFECVKSAGYSRCISNESFTIQM